MAQAGHIPVVDLSPCWSQATDSCDTAGIQQCSRAICQAFSEVGFVYLTHHGVPKKQLDDVLEKSGQFFQLPSESKAAYRRPDDNSNHGWVQLQRESLNPQRPGDYKEAYNITPSTAKQWPDDVVSEFRATTMAMYRSCETLALTVLDLMGQGLGMKDTKLFSKCHNFTTEPNVSTLRCLYYPPLPEDTELQPGQVRCGEHSDYGSITLLFQDEVGGLEVRTIDGDYVAAPPLEGAVLVNIGDLMQRWTVDKLCSTKHRVMIPEVEVTRRRARQSVAFFAHPDNDCVVRCIDGSDKYEPITGMDYLKLRFQATY